MHSLKRQIRFSIDPFLNSHNGGDNSFCSKPAGDGLAIWFGLWVELCGKVNSDTGFVVNVVDIDRLVRQTVVGMFDEYIKEKFNSATHITCEDLALLLSQTSDALANKFAPLKLTQTKLALNPYRMIAVNTEDKDMMYFSEKFEFAASHKLWNKSLTDDENFTAFGKCANPAGHGHNYVVEVVVKKNANAEQLQIGQYQTVVKNEFLNIVDHKNLNADIEFFKDTNPTVENIADFAFDCLTGKFIGAELDCINVWESDRTCATRR